MVSMAIPVHAPRLLRSLSNEAQVPRMSARRRAISRKWQSSATAVFLATSSDVKGTTEKHFVDRRLLDEFRPVSNQLTGLVG